MSKKLSDRTCNNCKYRPEGITCKLFGTITDSKLFERGCIHFAPIKITNGDKIRAMSDEELAEKFIYTRREQNGDKCYLSTIRVGKWSTKEEALEATLEELKKELKKGIENEQ